MPPRSKEGHPASGPPVIRSVHDDYFLLSCSPRPGGNSDTAAKLFAQGYRLGLNEAPAKDLPPKYGPEPVFLRESRVIPCTACGCCEKTAPSGQEQPPFGCPFALRDDSAALLARLISAREICLVSPIYFYHLPAILKALIDRLQPFFWSASGEAHTAARPAPRLCRVILLAARSQGEQLFAGSLLTLRYALALLHIRLAEPLLLYGLDQPADLDQNCRKREQVIAYGYDAARQ